VPSTVKLTGLQIALDSTITVDRIAPMGNLFDTIAAPREEYATGSLAGSPTYPELAYVFSNVFGAATVTTPSGATLARKYAWAPSSSVPWTPRTWTIRRGMVGNTAEQAAYALLAGVSMTFSAGAAPSIAGDLFAQALDYAASVGASGVSALDNVPVLLPDVCVYLDEEAADIGETKLTRDFLAEWSLGGLFGVFWPIDCELDSFGGHVPLKPTADARLQLGNDGQGREPVEAMRTGDSRYLRIEATGPVIDEGPPAFHHMLRVDAALKVVSAPARGDSAGLSTLEWGFGLFDDADFGGALRIELTTNVATL
jgi:hypothetical protein